jgi:hypothetical protein
MIEFNGGILLWRLLNVRRRNKMYTVYFIFSYSFFLSSSVQLHNILRWITASPKHTALPGRPPPVSCQLFNTFAASLYIWRRKDTPYLVPGDPVTQPSDKHTMYFLPLRMPLESLHNPAWTVFLILFAVFNVVLKNTVLFKMHFALQAGSTKDPTPKNVRCKNFKQNTRSRFFSLHIVRNFLSLNHTSD